MHNKRLLFPLAILFWMMALLSLFSSTTFAQDCFNQIDVFDPDCDELIVLDQWWLDDGISIDHQFIDVTIDNQVATTVLDMQFSNANDWWVESTYLFPLPENATISRLVLYINGIPIEAVSLEKDEAQEIYDSYVDVNVDPALLQQVESSLYQLDVFPIEEQDYRRVIVEYQEVLLAENGTIEYRFPQNMNYATKSIGLQSINVAVNSQAPITLIESDTHTVTTNISDDDNGDTMGTVSYEGENVLPDRDFVVTYDVASDAIDLTLISHQQPITEDGYFLLLVDPAVDVPDAQIIPKDVIIAIDTSGSMGVEKMEQAKSAAIQVIEQLNPEDRFSIVTFESSVASYSTELLSAEARNIDLNEDGVKDYVAYIDEIYSGGGTNISDALLESLAQAGEERLTTILFLTDGQASSGITSQDGILDAIEDEVTENVRIFSFAIGNGADRTLLNAITGAHKGSTNYVESNSQVESAVTSFYDTISRPVLTDITIDFGDVPVDEIYPKGSYDLFVGNQLVVVGRYAPSVHDNITTTFPITITGDFNGTEQQFVYDGNTLAQGADSVSVPVEWAQRAVTHWENQIALEGESPELKQLIIDLGIKYNIVTMYTSLLAEDPTIEILFPTPTPAPLPTFVPSTGQPQPAPAPPSAPAPTDYPVVWGTSVPPTSMPQMQMTSTPQPTIAPTATPQPTEIPNSGVTVNCDNVWTLLDVILLKKFNAFLIGSDDNCTDAIANGTLYLPECDRNGDGTCGLVDGVIIQQCDAFIDNPYCGLDS